jgi:hypothetical protein
MVSPDEHSRGVSQETSYSNSISSGFVSHQFPATTPGINPPNNGFMPMGVPVLTMYNSSLNIRIQGINGAIIGRRQGPYSHFFQQNMYVSGVHAQLKYKANTGWCITDKHSSNGTKLNEHLLQPDVDMSIKNGDIVTIANVNLQVNIN